MSKQASGVSLGRTPEPADVSAVFQNHHTHFLETSGEVSYQQRQDEAKIQRQYSGRVLFELLQNALDRARSTVHVELVETDRFDEKYALFVANDGPQLHIDPTYDYDTPPEEDVGEKRRPDFNALCSLHTSNKSPDESVGTKGIGFRSVFSLSDYVQVWSRFDTSPGWWGIEMHSPLDGETWRDRRSAAAVERGHSSILGSQNVQIDDDDTRPSFHFPLPLRSDTGPLSSRPDDFSTAVVVPVSKDRLETLLKRFDQLEDSHLYFIGLFEDRREVTATFESLEHQFQHSTWPEEGSGSDQSYSLTHWHSSEFYNDAREADHDVSEPGAAVAWPPRPRECSENTGDEREATVYGYLPTLEESPFGIDVHGDFQLRIDRTGLRLDDDQVGPYNEKLLQVSAELHLLTVFRELGLPTDTVDWELIVPEEVTHIASFDEGAPPRADLWRLFNPAFGDSDAADVVISHIASLVFTADNQATESYRTWAVIADAFFDAQEEWSLASYEAFWQASESWVDRLCPTKTRQKTWRKTAAAMCDALQDRGMPLVPVLDREDYPRESSVSAVRLPDRSGGDSDVPSERHESVVFLRKDTESDLDLPIALQEADRAVTSFEFTSGFTTDNTPQPLGTRDFTRWEVLAELRQLPNSVTDWTYEPLAEDPEDAADYQRELIRFAAELYRLNTGSSSTAPAASEAYGLGWRVLETEPYSNAARQAGRALATLFLPTADGQWKPARELTRDRVAADELGTLPEDIDVDDFLTFLGVAPEPPEDGAPLTFVEGGEKNLVGTVEKPPALTRAGQGGISNATLSPLPEHGHPSQEFDPIAWRDSIHAAWEWLQPLLEAEGNVRVDQGRERKSDLFEPLSSRAWYPVGADGRYASAPAVIDDPAGAVAPRDITLVSSGQRRFSAVLWSVDNDSPDAEVLMALGAITGTDHDSLAVDSAAPALRLVAQLRDLELDAVESHSLARQGMVGFFGQLLKTIVRTPDAGPTVCPEKMLAYDSSEEAVALSDRPLAWKDVTTDEAWIPSDTDDRETMRRFFSERALVAAMIPAKVLTEYAPLANRGIDISQDVQPQPEEGEEDELVVTLENTLSELVPTLTALAAATQGVDVDPEEAAERWHSRQLHHVDNAYLTLHVSLGGDPIPPVRRFEDSSDVVLFTNRTQPTILFDTSDADGLPPIDEFSEPLAELLLGDGYRRAESVFLRALRTVGSDRRSLDDLIDRKGAEPLVDAYEGHFASLSEEATADLLDQVTAILNTRGLKLQDSAANPVSLRRLTPGDIEYIDSSVELSETELNEEFQKLELTESQERISPRFTARSYHRRQWKSWYTNWESRLLPYLQYRVASTEDEDGSSTGRDDISEEEIASELDAIVSEQCSMLTFEPEGAVREWLRTQDVSPPDDLETAVREYSPYYETVDHIESSSGWTRSRLGSPSPNREERGTVDPDDVVETMSTKSKVGEDAERAVLDLFTEQTIACIEEAATKETVETPTGTVDRPWEVLQGVIPSGGATERNLRDARERWVETKDPMALSEGLHISSVWDGAGYDLLGLEWIEGKLSPVRYEIKGLPQTDENQKIAKVHITNNQIATWQEVCETPNDPAEPRYVGDWRLIGVEPDGSAVDLTDELAEIPEDAIDSLRKNGFDHEGLVLYINRK